MNTSTHAIRAIQIIGLLLVIGVSSTLARQANGSLLGQVKDQSGAVVINANVILKNASGREWKTATGREGQYLFDGLPAGDYRLQISAKGFNDYQNNEIKLEAARRQTVDVSLQVIVREQVTIGERGNLSTDPDNNASGLVLRGSDLSVLPDDPNDLAAVLREFAGAAAGPDGVEITVEGFSGVRRLPGRQQIAEIRINQNPFTAEYDRIGFGRIDIRLNPTTEEFHGGGEFYFTDESLNSRNPFVSNRAPYQVRNFFGSLSGPLVAKRASFYAAVAREAFDANSIVNATILDDALQVTPFSRAILVPSRQLYSDFRVDLKANQNNNLTFNYQYLPTRSESDGIENFSLPSRGYDTRNLTHIFRTLVTSVLGPNLVNQSRFQYIWNRTRLSNTNTMPTIEVLQAFTGGGPLINNDRTTTNRLELQDNMTYGVGHRTLRFGARLRWVKIIDISPYNFNGTYTFAGGSAPVLGQNGQIVTGPNGQPLLTEINSLERYRRTLFFQRQGLTPAEINARGGGASQFSIAAGNPEIGVTQFDVGGYAQYDWRLSHSFNLGMGLRYENQSNIDSNMNFAPRISFAWAPGVNDQTQPKTVIRGGAGVFYLRFNEVLTLQTRQFGGVTQQQFIVNDPAILGFFPAVPPLNVFQNFGVPQTIKVAQPGLSAPYSYQASLSIERQLPRRTTFSATFLKARYIHLLRSRNINAPLPGTFDPDDPASAVRPIAGSGNIFSFESGGWLNQTQLILHLNTRLHPKVSFFSTYTLNRSRSDTNGSTWFPANSYDLADEYGRSNLDVRHRISFGGSFSLPWDMTLNPLVIARSGLPFNITTGRDTNGDTVFNERPALATDLSKPGVINTRFGAFDPNPAPGQRLVPINYAAGPAFLIVNLRAAKTFRLGPRPAAKENQGNSNSKPERPYSLTLSVAAQNLFNRNNPAVPIGNLLSPFFGQSVASATDAGASNPNNNRRINLSLNFSF
ncbi:MAG TPA: carboxypeptidase-like regulatory domain-containing protein [Blastocatellia bacterium]|nr:carboxypeptidase-like regulatory domain-containing protein [Blastocatellia bacterium]